MPYQDPIHPPENYIPRQMYTLYSVFCLLLSAFLFSIATPFLRFVQGQALSASEGRLRTTLELTTDPPQALLSSRGATEWQAGWAATYGGTNYDWAESVQQTSDGGYIVAGYLSSSYFESSFGSGVGGLWVLKLRPDGTVEWQKAYGKTNEEGAESIQQTSDGGYIVAGWTKSFGAGEEDFWVLRLRPDGAVEWQKTYGGVDRDRANSIQQTHNGGYIVAGWTKSFGAGEEDFWVLRLRSDGTVEWQKTYGGVDRDEARSIQQTQDGGFIVTGYTRSFGAGDYDFWVLKLKPDGTVEWQKTYGGVNGDGAKSAQQTSDGGYIAAGVTESFGAGGADLWVMKLGPDGTVEWQKTYGGVDWDCAQSIQQTRDGGYIAAGWTELFIVNKDDPVARWDLWVLKLMFDGTVEWQKAYGGAELEWAESIQQTSDGGYIVSGRTSSFSAGGVKIDDFWVLKLRPDGSIHPSCGFVRDTNISGKDFNATVTITSGIARDSNAHPQDFSATVTVTKVSPRILCP